MSGNPNQADIWLMIKDMPGRARINLFCFPHAGGGANFFRPWRAHLPDEAALLLPQLPGREVRIAEKPISNLSQMIDELTGALIRCFERRPFVFFGHSMGALIAFELTRRLRRLGAPQPLQLFVSGRNAPQRPSANSPIHHLPDKQFLAEVRRFNGIPTEIAENAEILDLILPILRADIELCETYVYAEEPPLDYPITTLGGLADAETNREGLEAWAEMTRRDHQLHMFPGDHFFPQTARDQVLNIISSRLELLIESLDA